MSRSASPSQKLRAKALTLLSELRLDAVNADGMTAVQAESVLRDAAAAFIGASAARLDPADQARACTDVVRSMDTALVAGNELFAESARGRETLQ